MCYTSCIVDSRQVTTESVDPGGTQARIDEAPGDSNVEIIDEVAIFERNKHLCGDGKYRPTINGPRRIYENTSFEANYMNIVNVKPEQPDDELNQTNYMHLEATTREASQIPSIYRSLIVPKSRSHQPENTDSERSYINTIGD